MTSVRAILASLTAVVVVLFCVPAGVWAQGSLPAACAAFTDDPLNAGMSVKAAHVAELRACVDALRNNTGLAAYPWTDPAVVPTVTSVRAVHVAQLRSALGEAYAAEGLFAPAGYTDTTLVAGVTEIRRLHIAELRSAARALGLTNAPPVISGPSNQTQRALTTVSVPVVASDPEGAALIYAATGLPAGLSINATTGVISGTLPNVDTTYSVAVSAYDGAVYGRRTFNWTVTMNHAPAISGPSRVTNFEGASVSIAMLG